MKVLVVGGLGFIGFNALQSWSVSCPHDTFFCYDVETYAAKFMLKQKKAWLKQHKIPCIKADVRDAVAVDKAVTTYGIDTIVNFAAESHVDNSIASPEIFFSTNVVGTVNCLEAARKHKCRFHQISTDEVIGAITPESGLDCTETARLCPTSPYAASKAAAELAVMSYIKTFKVNATISRCTNNFGPWQHPEKLIPTVITNACNDKQIPVYGNGKQRRYWIFVDEHNENVMNILRYGTVGETYNIAPSAGKKNLMYNIDIVKSILKSCGKPESLISYVKDRPAHDICYWLDASKIKCKGLAWHEQFDMKTRLMLTVDWYRKNLKI